MAAAKEKDNSPGYGEEEKGSPEGHKGEFIEPPQGALHQKLQGRHMQMIAIGMLLRSNNVYAVADI